MLRSASLIIASLVATIPATAQTVLLTIPGHAAADRFGSGLDSIGDIDGDGGLDLAIGAAGAGEVWLVRVSDGSTIAVLKSGKSSFGTNVSSLGDVTGDGLSDILVSAPKASIAGASEAGAAYVLTCPAFTTKLSYEGYIADKELGYATGAVGDLDLDGWPDFGLGFECITSPFGSGCIGAGDGHLFSTQGGASIGGYSEGPQMYAPAGDVNGDGVGEYFSSWTLGYGQVELDLLGAPLTPLAKVLDDYVGFAVATAAGRAADFDGDGLDEYVFAHLSLRSGLTLDIRSAVPPHTVLTLDVPLASGLELGAVDARADLDGDGTADVLVGLPQLGVGGSVQAWSGADGHVLFTLVDHELFDRLGSRIVILGDLTGDGHPEFAVSAPAKSEAAGRVFIVSPMPPAWVEVGTGLAGTLGLPHLAGYGPLAAGTAGTLRLNQAAPNAAVILVTGFDEIELPFKGGVLVPKPDGYIGGIVTSSAGTVKLDFAIPVGTPSWLEVWMQMWIEDTGAPKGLAASNGLKATTQG